MNKLFNLNRSKTATTADYARLDFAPALTLEQANRFAGNTLSDICISIRTAAAVLSKTKQELLEGFGQNTEVLMDAIDDMQELQDWLKSLKEIVTAADVRLMSVASVLTQEEDAKSVVIPAA